MYKNRYLDINNSQQWIQFNKHRESQPLMLIVDGGFYQPEIHRLIYTHTKNIAGLTLVLWDQRGLGYSKNAVDNWSDINIDYYTADLITLVHHLLAHFRKEKLYLLSHCFGTIPGLLAAYQHPECFHAYISVAQVVNPLENILISNEKLLNLEEASGSDRPIHHLQKQEILSGEAGTNSKIRQNAKEAYRMDPTAQSMSAPGILGKLLQITMNPIQHWNYRSGSRKRRKYLHSEILDINFSETIQKLSIPVYFLVGRQDKISPPELTENYFRKLKAPHKTFIWFEKSGHFPFLQEPDKFNNVLRKEMAISQDTSTPKPTPIWDMVMSLC